ncbi:hypothetical protein D4R99_02940 [bacterium]|nr:MAG: hypothetical protein D4R99_02940 [bacterium]
MENPKIIVSGVTGDTSVKEEMKSAIRSRVEKTLNTMREEKLHPFEGEVEKTEKQLAYIDAVERYLQKTFKILNIPHEGRFIDPDQVHYFPKDILEKNFSDITCDVGGFFSTADRALCMKSYDDSEKEELNKTEIRDLENLAHESIHLVSHSKFQANLVSGTKLNIGNYRTGYLVQSSESGEMKFNGFNEGVVCITERLSLINEAEELKRQFNATDKQIENLGYDAYIQNQMLVYALVGKIAEYRKESPVRALSRIIRGQFTGEMMHLRDVDDIYGKGSLDLLAKYQSSKDPRMNGDRDDLILAYFQSDDQEERDDLKKKIDDMESKKEKIN